MTRFETSGDKHSNMVRPENKINREFSVNKRNSDKQTKVQTKKPSGVGSNATFKSGLVQRNCFLSK